MMIIKNCSREILLDKLAYVSSLLKTPFSPIINLKHNFKGNSLI